MGFTVAEVVEWTHGQVVNSTDLGQLLSQIRVERLASLGGSRAQDLAFFFSRHYEKDLFRAAPGVLITGDAFVKPMQAAQLPLWKQTAVVTCSDPYLAMALLSEKFAPSANSATETQIHPTAVVHPQTKMGSGVCIGPNVVVEEGVRIGAQTIIQAASFIGKDSQIGDRCVLFPRVTIYSQTQIGHRVRIHSGAVIGADGFGYAPIHKNGQVVGHQKIYHLGSVVIGDDVEMGANVCIDRGTFGETRVDKNSKLDNMVHVGHNAHVEEGAVLCGGVFLAGNAHIGKYAYIGGLTGVINKIYIGDRSQVGACSLISKDIPPGGTGLGNPQRDYREHFRAHAALNKLISGRNDSSKNSPKNSKESV